MTMMTRSESRWQTAEQAMAHVRSGMAVACTSLSAEPLALTAALWRRAMDLEGITLVTGMMVSGYPFLQPEMRGKIRLCTWFMPGTLIKGVPKDIDADFLPLTWCQAAKYMRAASIDVALVQVTPADENGYHSFGISTAQSRGMVDSARMVIAQVNPRMPRTCGDSLVHTSEFDVLVAAEHALPEFPHREGDETDRNVARRAAEMVPDGATIQMGIGTIPTSFVEALIELERKDLRLLSLMADPVRRLIEAGCCTQEDPKIVAVDILGTSELYRWVEGNPSVRMTDSIQLNSAASLCERNQFVSVISALEIDLWGQVNSERLQSSQAGGVGGSLDFAMSNQVVDGVSIIALRSTAKGGRSRIVESLNDPVVTLPRHLPQIVVTEFGVADLRFLHVRERARALARVAHPEHREKLMQAADRVS